MQYGFESSRDKRLLPFWSFVHAACDVPLHWHNETELLLVLQGSLSLSVDDEECHLKAGDVMIINPGQTHQSTAASPDAILCGVHLDTAFYEGAGLPGLTGRELQLRSFLHGRHYDRVTNPVRALIAATVLMDQDDRGAVAGMSYAGLLADFIYQNVSFVERTSYRKAIQGGGRALIQEIMVEVRDTLSPPTLQQLADRKRISLSHLCWLFKQQTGLGYGEFVQNVRLDRIAARLLSSSESISDIAYEEGFSNGSHLYGRFRKRFGQTPSEYRKSRSGSPQPATRSATSDVLDLLRPYLQHLPLAIDETLNEARVAMGAAIAAPHGFSQHYMSPQARLH